MNPTCFAQITESESAWPRKTVDYDKYRLLLRSTMSFVHYDEDVIAVSCSYVLYNKMLTTMQEGA